MPATAAALVGRQKRMTIWLQVRQHTLTLRGNLHHPYAPLSQPGGLGKAHQFFGNDLNRILEELNLALVA